MRITSAPQSARWRTQVGPARASVRSSTLMLESGRVFSSMRFNLPCRLFTMPWKSRVAPSTDRGGLLLSLSTAMFIGLIWSSIIRDGPAMEYPVDRARLAKRPPIHPGIIFGDIVMPELRKERTIAEIAALLGSEPRDPASRHRRRCSDQRRHGGQDSEAMRRRTRIVARFADRLRHVQGQETPRQRIGTDSDHSLNRAERFHSYRDSFSLDN